MPWENPEAELASGHTGSLLPTQGGRIQQAVEIQTRVATMRKVSARWLPRWMFTCLKGIKEIEHEKAIE